MLIQQIIRKQTIGILDKILQLKKQEVNRKDENQKRQQKQLSIGDFIMNYHQRGLIKDDQKQILILLLQKHVGNVTQDGKENNAFPKLTQSEAFQILKQIKQKLTQQKAIPSQKISNHVNQDPQNQQSNPTHQTAKQSLQNFEVTEFTPFIQNNRISTISNHQAQSKQQISRMSKNLKKQFIMRNIDRIRKYATQINQTVIDYERTQLQEMKISHQISHKLFHLYKSIYPSGVGNKEMLNFETKEQYKTTLNYHKILEMFNHALVKLEIQSKLSLLRMVKKFAFNQNFIQIEEWLKIYRSIINSLNVKEVTLQRLVKQKEEEKKSSKFILQDSILKKQPINQKAEIKYRTRRIKTQASVPQSRLLSMPNIAPETVQSQYLSKINYSSNKSGIRPIESIQKNQSYKTYNPNEYRAKHKKLLKDVSEVALKNLKKDLRSEKMIGIEKEKVLNNNSSIKEDDMEDEKNQYSYLRKAIKSKKISKITWETLFQMKEDTMHHNIVIPDFAKELQDD